MPRSHGSMKGCAIMALYHPRDCVGVAGNAGAINW
jgi:hypothetical protein